MSETVWKKTERENDRQTEFKISREESNGSKRTNQHTTKAGIE